VAFLRRLFGGGEPPAEPDDHAEPAAESSIAAGEPEDEEARRRELMRAEAVRLDDDLIQRQLRYADRSWVPPREGGERRADDADRDADA
jgi:hypothetical protein